jgi:hypothetical protein
MKYCKKRVLCTYAGRMVEARYADKEGHVGDIDDMFNINVSIHICNLNIFFFFFFYLGLCFC